MSKSTFIDVGANIGQSLEAALRFKFDRIVCFEPVTDSFNILKRSTQDPRVEFHNLGLWNKNCSSNIYSPHTLAATLYKDHLDAEAGSVACMFVKASEWFRDFVSPDEELVVKMNCEGAECDIVLDLLQSGEFRKVKNMMIDFDAKKVPSQCHKVMPVQQALLGLGLGPKVCLCDDVMHGTTHVDRISNWLRLIEIERL
jgi:FkbM family methyltransferase